MSKTRNGMQQFAVDARAYMLARLPEGVGYTLVLTDGHEIGVDGNLPPTILQPLLKQVLNDLPGKMEMNP